MANIGLWAQKNMLDWVLKGAAPASPPAAYIGLSLGPPASNASSEVAGGSGYTRQSPGFAPASTPAGSGSTYNSAAATFGPFSTSAVISGLFIADTISSAAGNMLWYGNLATPRTPLAGDSLVLATSALIITLS
jgi:hypothetical protein